MTALTVRLSQFDKAMLENLVEKTGESKTAPGRTHQKLSNEPRYRSPFIGDLTRGTF